MAAVGVVAEYNPLHKGHVRHLALTRAACPGLPVVVCMSGNWVQRGECAIQDKWARARQACENGADLVIELPSLFAVSAAATFARAAVSLLAAAGITHLSFGCETPEADRLQALARALDEPAFDRALQPLLRQGLPFPAARQRALAELVGAETAALVASPNNNLAVEYLRALPVYITPVLIQRAGAHDGGFSPDFPSASALRALLREGNITQAEPYLAAPWDSEVHEMRLLERAILCKLRQKNVDQLMWISDAGDGLAPRLWRAAQAAGSLDELYALARTRRFPLARIRRVVLWAFWGLTQADRPPAPEYLRVLAMTRAGAAHLAALKTSCPLPILTKSADHKEPLALESRLTDLYALCAPTILPCGEEWRRSPVLVERPRPPRGTGTFWGPASS